MFSPRHCKSKIPAHLKLSTQMPTFNIFELRQRFRKSVEYLWRYRIFAVHTVQVESGKISNVVDAQSFHLAIAKVKYLRTWNFPLKCPPSTSSSWSKVFENRLNTFGDTGFLLWQWTGWKWQNFKCCRCAKFSPRHCKSKIPAHLKLSTQMPTFNIVELKAKISKIGWIPLEIQDFCWHSVQVESGKISNVVDAQSFRLAIATVNYLRTWNFPPKCPPSTSSSWGKEFENRLNTFGDIGFLLAPCTGWKWQNFKCCRCAKFSHCHCKSKIPAQLKLSTQMPTSQDLRRWGKDFENRLNTFGDIGFLLAHCTGWKWQNFKCCRCAKFSPRHCKSKIPAHLKLSTQMPTFNIVELKQNFRKSVEYLWKYRIFAGTLYRLKVAKFQMLSMRKVFTSPLQN